MCLNPFTAILELISKRQLEPALLAQVDYLRAENKILREQLTSLKINDTQRRKLAELGMQLKNISKELLESTVNIVQPDTILRWHRKLVAKKFDGSANRETPKVKRITKEIEAEIIKIALEDLNAGYDKIVGYLQDLGVSFSNTTIANILRKNGINPAPERKYDKTWTTFIKEHSSVMWGCDFFTHEVWSKSGLVTYYVLVMIHLSSRKLKIVNVTQNPTQEWTVQQMRNFFYDSDTDPEVGNMKYLLHDKGTQFQGKFKDFFKNLKNENDEDIKLVQTTCAQQNGFCERVIQSIQNECTDRLIFFGEHMLRYALKEYVKHYNSERHHQGIDNIIPFPEPDRKIISEGEMRCKTRLGGLLKSYYRKAG